MSSELLVLTLQELRDRFEAHQRTRPAAGAEGFEAWLKENGRLRFHIELKEGEERMAWHQAEGPAHAHPPSPMAAPSPATALRGPGFSKNRPTLADLPAAPPTQPAPSEPAMPSKKAEKASPKPKKQPSTVERHASLDGAQKRIAHLLKNMAASAEQGKRLYWAAQEIRDLCTAWKLDIPKAAQKVTAKGVANRKTKKTKESPPPQRLEVQAPAVEPVAPVSVIVNLKPKTPEPRPELADLPVPAARLRALRTQALELLPELADLPADVRAVALKELELLADCLVLGGQLLGREAVS